MGLDSRPQNYRRNDNMPADFKKMYLQMAGKVDDALAMLEAGATLVQICTEFIYGGGKSLRDIRMGLNERFRKIEMRKAREAGRERTSPERDLNETER